MKSVETPDGIYVASRASIPARAAMWREFRKEGVRINSTWIDEDGPGETDDFSQLWARIVQEIAASRALVLYAEPGDFPLKGALVEVGMALALGKPVIACLPDVQVDYAGSMRPVGSWMAHWLVTRCDNIDLAVQEAEIEATPATAKREE